MARTLNLGILAHVDAGKTSLTEQLLYLAGVIPAIGSVDAGSTQTDSLELERQRGITIRASVVAFEVDDVMVNLIDTPGHPDFIAEVERVLSVLDGAVLVVSAVEGVQAQTRVLMRALQRLSVPTLIFINKIDRRGADEQRVLRQIGERLSPNVVALGSVREPGTRGATFIPCDPSTDQLAERVVEFLATVGLRIEPGSEGSGIIYRVEQELHGTLPFAFFTAIEDAVHETLRQGLSGWQVTDCVITLTHTGYWARQSSAHGSFDKSMSSTAGDFRNLTPLLLMDALQQAGTNVYEPLQRFRLEAPADTFSAVLSALARFGASPDAPHVDGGLCIVEGEIPAAKVQELRQQLPRLTGGAGVLEETFERYALVQGVAPERPRSDNNPLNRKEYLLNLTRRV